MLQTKTQRQTCKGSPLPALAPVLLAEVNSKASYPWLSHLFLPFSFNLTVVIITTLPTLSLSLPRIISTKLLIKRESSNSTSPPPPDPWIAGPASIFPYLPLSPNISQLPLSLFWDLLCPRIYLHPSICLEWCIWAYMWHQIPKANLSRLFVLLQQTLSLVPPCSQAQEVSTRGTGVDWLGMSISPESSTGKRSRTEKRL